MKIKTYAVNCNDAWLNTEGDDISGSYVKYKEHQEVVSALEAKCAALAAENAGMSARTPVAYSYRYAWCETCDGFQDWRWELSKEKPPEWMLETGKVTNLVELFELPETPATDAFLDEVRAQGVELAISQAFSDVTPVNRMQFISRMTAFAAQLRKGGNQ